MRKKIVFLLAFLCMLLLAGCSNGKETSKYNIEYLNKDKTGIAEMPYDASATTTDALIEEFFAALSSDPDNVEYRKPIPNDVEITKYSLDGALLTIYFDVDYLNMKEVEEVLCRAALVRSLTQINGVDLVMICVDGTPLTDKKGNAYGYQQAEDFVQNTGSSINSFQEMKLTLYYADSSGEKLQKEEDMVRYNSNESKERVVVEQLMRGPSNNRLLATIPKGTKLLGVSIKDHICYLNFDEGLRNIAPGVSPETVIYSIVNSVIDGGNVSEVQISINGDSSIVYQESIKLDEPLSRNQEMIKED